MGGEGGGECTCLVHSTEEKQNSTWLGEHTLEPNTVEKG